MRRNAIPLISTILLLTGCLENPTPERARVFMRGEAGKSVRIITAREFVATTNEQGLTRVIILRADTTVATLPFSKEYNIEREQQFFIEAGRHDSDVPNLRMQVYIDERLQFDEGGLLKDRPFRYIYVFNFTGTRDITVVI